MKHDDLVNLIQTNMNTQYSLRQQAEIIAKVLLPYLKSDDEYTARVTSHACGFTVNVFPNNMITNVRCGLCGQTYNPHDIDERVHHGIIGHKPLDEKN